MAQVLMMSGNTILEGAPQGHRFMPEQFLSDWPKGAFISFSKGIFLHIIRQPTITLQVPVLLWEEGASCCRVIEVEWRLHKFL